ncbi:MAG: tyrosine-type recombinase/integrase, partial [Leptolyngbya sp. SIO4C1]|nr:tyrosine-type recombinase/integrase [Leptolyngbya sp. SIO4C1]
ETLAKYKLQAALSTTESNNQTQAVPSLTELWERYCEVRKPVVKAGTWRNGYKVNTSHFSRCPYDSLDEAQQIFDWAMTHLKPDPAKRLIQALGACCKWAVRSHLIAYNPFDNMTRDIKIPKTSSEDDDIDPFTREERHAIIEAFSNSFYYRHYVDLVKFLFYTGCRPSEAIGLQWKHVTRKQITFEQGVVQSENGLVLQQGLKSQEKRRFPVNAQLLKLFQEIRLPDTSKQDFVFPGPRGKFIDFHNFRNRGWKKIMEQLGIRYRKPYQTRHTFVTHCLEEGVSVQQVAKWVGNTPEVIMKHYAGRLAQIQVPEI